jgi:hypothetical protein
MKKILSLLCCFMFVFASCGDEFEYSSQFSSKYPVRFYFNVSGSAELINAIGNPGEYVTIRRKSGTGYVRIENTLGGNDYSLSFVGSTDFLYGLGGLIVGTSNVPNMNNGFDLIAYDLACPTCDRPERRLSLKGNGTAKCSKCGLTYDMNNLGVIVNADDSVSVNNARVLYRYRITYDGQAIRVFN